MKLKIFFILIVSIIISQAGGWTSVSAYDFLSDIQYEVLITSTLGSTGRPYDGFKFTVPSTDTFNTITLPVSKVGSAHTDGLQIKIYSYLSDISVGSLLYTSNSVLPSAMRVSCGTVAVLLCNIPFTFSSSVTLVSGVNYYFIISRTGNADNTSYYNSYIKNVTNTFTVKRIACNNCNLTNFTLNSTTSPSMHFKTSVTLLGSSSATRLYHISPVTDSTTVSSIFNIVYGYYVNSVTDPTLNTIQFQVCPLSYAFNNCYSFTAPVTSSNILHEVTLSGVNVSYNGDYEVSMWLSNGSIDVSCSWWQFWCTETVYVTGAGDLWRFKVVYASGTNGVPVANTVTTFYAPDSPSACAIATFDFGDCGISVFVPKKEDLAGEWKKLKTNVLSAFPLGYITRFITLMLDPASVQPPALSYKFGTAVPSDLKALTDNDPIVVNPLSSTNMAFINSIRSDQVVPQTIWDIFNPIFQILVNLTLLWAMLSELLRIDFSSSSRGSSNSRLKDPKDYGLPDYSKMSDQEFAKKTKITYANTEKEYNGYKHL